MEQLSITLLNVGCGDSIFLEYEEGTEYKCGLIDSKDTTKIKNSHCYLNRHFKEISIEKNIKLKNPYFDFVMVSHDHSDHTEGIKDIIMEYGAENFYYSISKTSIVLKIILNYVKRKNIKCQLLNYGDDIYLGPIKMKVLWPDVSRKDSNENNNSIVLLIEFCGKKILLTGDVEESVWTKLKNSKIIPKDINLIKLPHHGSRTGFFDSSHAPIWRSCLAVGDNKIGISTNPSPVNYHLPSVDVIKNLEASHHEYYRTDVHENIKFIIDKSGIRCKYSHE